VDLATTFRLLTPRVFEIVYAVPVGLPRVDQCLGIALSSVSRTKPLTIVGSPGAPSAVVDSLSSNEWASSLWNGPTTEDSVALGTAGYEMASTRAEIPQISDNRTYS
jgi:hypothetical protein